MAQIWWADHLTHVKDGWPPKQLLYGGIETVDRKDRGYSKDSTEYQRGFMESSCAECTIEVAELVTVCWLPNKNQPKERQHQNYLKGFLHKCLHVEGIVHAMDFSAIYIYISAYIYICSPSSPPIQQVRQTSLSVLGFSSFQGVNLNTRTCTQTTG